MSRIFRVFVPASVIGLIFSEFTLILLCYIAGSWLVGWFINPDFDLAIFVREDAGLIKIAVVALCLIAGIYFQDLYSTFRIKSLTILIQQLCLVAGFAFLIQALFAYARHPEWSLPRWAMIFGSFLMLLVLPAWRSFYSNVVVRALASQRILFLGASPVIQEIGAHL